MRCLGITKSIKRCKNDCRVFFCRQHRFQLFTALLFVISVIVTLVDFREIFKTPKEIINVARIIEGDDFFKEVKEKFEKENPGYEIRYHPDIGAAEENSTMRFRRFIEDENSIIDIFVGGNTFLHEYYSGKMKKVRDIILEHEKRGVNHGTAFTWLSFYDKYIGFAWRESAYPANWALESFDQLDTLEAYSIEIPSPKTSAGYDFLITLSVDSNHYNLTKGKERYKRYLTRYYKHDYNSVSSCKILAKTHLISGAVTWPHDAMIAKSDRNYQCIKISIPQESIRTQSAISVYENSKVNPQGIKAFIDFLLSEEIQELHYSYNRRISTLKNLQNKELGGIQKYITMQSPEMENIPYDSLDIIINDLENFKSNLLSLSEKNRANAKSSAPNCE